MDSCSRSFVGPTPNRFVIDDRVIVVGAILIGGLAGLAIGRHVGIAFGGGNAVNGAVPCALLLAGLGGFGAKAHIDRRRLTPQAR